MKKAATQILIENIGIDLCVLEEASWLLKQNYIFLLECTAYEELRKDTFNETWLIRRNKQTFNKIMSCSEKRDIYKVANFLLKAFELRKMLIT